MAPFLPDRRRHLLVACAWACGASSAAAAPNVKTPLDMPARLTPRAAGLRLLAVARGGDGFIAVGPRGHVLRSADGDHWTQQPVPVASDLVDLRFPTPQAGWAVGHDGVVLHSRDGGQQWQVVLDGRRYGTLMVAHYQRLLGQSPADERLQAALAEAQRLQADGADKPFLGLHFESDQAGWVFGAFNLILRTEDAGRTWTPWLDRTANEAGYMLYGMAAAEQDVYLVGELGTLRRLDRRSGHFEALALPYKGSLFGAVGRPGCVVVYGLRGHAFVSRDRGQRWAVLDTGSASTVTSACFLPDGRLVMTNLRGDLLVSRDARLQPLQPLRALPSRSGVPLYGVTAADSRSVVVVGERGAQRLAIGDV